jgi:hypothetical protein
MFLRAFVKSDFVIGRQHCAKTLAIAGEMGELRRVQSLTPPKDFRHIDHGPILYQMKRLQQPRRI